MPSPTPFPVPRELEWTSGSAPAHAVPQVRVDASLPAEGFALEVDGDGIRLAHADANGRRHAEACLSQLRDEAGGVPGVRIRDWPDFPVRGYLLDVSRDRVPTRETLERVVDVLALCRLNQLQLYTEHSFAYRDHEVVWRDASPLTPDDVRWLDSLCQQRGIELVANQNGFGHMGRWLQHDAYRTRAESPDGWPSSLGTLLPPATLAANEDNAKFVLGLVRELMQCFTSKRVNIGFDEPFELGMGRSRALVEARGKGRVFLEQLERVLSGLHADGCEVLFWGDVLARHPELVDELPRDATLPLAWTYEAPRDPLEIPAEVREMLAGFGLHEGASRGFVAQVGPYAESGRPYWVCPGTSSWNSLVGRLANARRNLEDAADVGLANGATGYLITDWGDNGHLQPPSVSFAPLVHGAAQAWCAARNRDLDVAAVLDRWVFRDAAGVLGGVLERIGDAYLGTGQHGINGSPLFLGLVGRGLAGRWGEVDAAATRVVAESLDGALADLSRARPGCPDADLVLRELAQAIRLARHGAWRMLRTVGASGPSDAELRRDLSGAIDEQRACWLARARPGGLADSLAPLKQTLASYGVSP